MSSKSGEIIHWMRVIWTTLKERLIKALLLKFLPKYVGGPIGWIASTVGGYALEKLIRPGYDWITRKTIMFFKKNKNKRKADDLQNSKTEDEFNSTFDDLP